MAHTIKDNGLPVGQGLYWDRNVIWFKICYKGRIVRDSCKTDKWQEALLVREKEKAKLIRGEKVMSSSVVRVNEVLDDYIAKLKRSDASRETYTTKTAYDAEIAFRLHIRPTFGKMKAHRVETKHLNAHVDSRLESGASRVTINRELSYMRAALNLGRKATPQKVAIVPVFPIDIKAEKRARRTGTLSDKQYELLWKHLPSHMKPLLPTVVYSGLRQKEARYIRWSQIDWNLGIIQLRAGETKDGDARAVPMISKVKDALLPWKAWTEDNFPEAEFVFHYMGQQVGSYRTAWNAAIRRADREAAATGGPRLRAPRLSPDGTQVRGKSGRLVFDHLVKFHDTRRTNRTLLTEAGVQHVDSKSTMGHKTDEIHDAYSQSKTAAQRVAATLEAHLNPALNSELDRKTPTVDIASQIERLERLLSKGVLTNQQYQQAVNKVLS
jgi:integrase